MKRSALQNERVALQNERKVFGTKSLRDFREMGPRGPFLEKVICKTTPCFFCKAGLFENKSAKFRSSDAFVFTKRIMSPEIRPKSFRTFEKRAPGLLRSRLSRFSGCHATLPRKERAFLWRERCGPRKTVAKDLSPEVTLKLTWKGKGHFVTFNWICHAPSKTNFCTKNEHIRHTLQTYANSRASCASLALKGSCDAPFKCKNL